MPPFYDIYYLLIPLAAGIGGYYLGRLLKKKK
jgi:hypothetical protein